MSNNKFPMIARHACAAVALTLVACAESDSERLASILNIPGLPQGTTIESCGSIMRDQEPMWDCIVQTNPGDFRILLSGHEFTELRVDAPEQVHLAKPTNFEAADHIHVLYNETTGKAAIATHQP